MILYDNRKTREIILRKSGSVLFRWNVFIPAVLSTLLASVHLMWPEFGEYMHLSVDMARVYSSILGFVIVMRTTMSFGRFFGGIHEVTKMFAKWRDACLAIFCFIEVSVYHHRLKGNVAATIDLQAFKARMLHWFTLLNALAVLRLQDPKPEEEMDEDDGDTMGDLLYVQQHLKFAVRSIINNSFDPAKAQTIRNTASLSDAQSQEASSALVATATDKPSLTDDRAAQSPAAPALSGLSQLPPPGGTTRSFVRLGSRLSFGTSTISVRRTESDSTCEQIAMRRGQSLADRVWSGGSGTPLASMIRPSRVSSKFGETLAGSDTRPSLLGKLTHAETLALSTSSDMVSTVMKWLISDMSVQSLNKNLLVPPPIVSRCYQELSNGMLGCAMATKVIDVPFPFPFAQFMQWALYAFALVCPLVVSNDNMARRPEDQLFSITWMSLLVNFMAVFGYLALNEISVELEDPFGEDDNDYPVHIQQISLVESLEDCYFQEIPTDFNQKGFTSRKQLDSIMEKGEKLALTRVLAPQPDAEKKTQEVQRQALAKKFEDVRNALAASSIWAKRYAKHPSWFSFDAPVPKVAGLMNRILDIAGLRDGKQYNAGPTENGMDDLRRKLNFLLFDSVGLQTQSTVKFQDLVEEGEAFAPREAGEEEDGNFLSKQGIKDLRRLISKEYAPDEAAQMQWLLEQHVASGELLRKAIAKDPSLAKIAPDPMMYNLSSCQNVHL